MDKTGIPIYNDGLIEKLNQTIENDLLTYKGKTFKKFKRKGIMDNFFIIYGRGDKDEIMQQKVGIPDGVMIDYDLKATFTDNLKAALRSNPDVLGTMMVLEMKRKRAPENTTIENYQGFDSLSGPIVNLICFIIATRKKEEVIIHECSVENKTVDEKFDRHENYSYGQEANFMSIFNDFPPQ